jgi:hypothetical protein
LLGPTDADLLATTIADLGGRNIMGNFCAGKMLKYLASAVVLLSLLFDKLLGRRGNRELRRL